MATKNCPKCESANPVACKKCACGHVFFTSRRSANTLATDYVDEISEPSTPQEPEVPRRRTARVTRERPQFYDALQVENQTRRQRELQKRRKASKSEDVDVSSEDISEKISSVTSSKKQTESPPTKSLEPPTKKRRGRPPGLTNRRTGRAQILSAKSIDPNLKSSDYTDHLEESEAHGNLHNIPPVKALQMNLVLSDINFRIANSTFRENDSLPTATTTNTDYSENGADQQLSADSPKLLEADKTLPCLSEKDDMKKISDVAQSPNSQGELKNAENVINSEKDTDICFNNDGKKDTEKDENRSASAEVDSEKAVIVESPVKLINSDAKCSESMEIVTAVKEEPTDASSTHNENVEELHKETEIESATKCCSPDKKEIVSEITLNPCDVQNSDEPDGVIAPDAKLDPGDDMKSSSLTLET